MIVVVIAVVRIGDVVIGVVDHVVVYVVHVHVHVQVVGVAVAIVVVVHGHIVGAHNSWWILCCGGTITSAQVTLKFGYGNGTLGEKPHTRRRTGR